MAISDSMFPSYMRKVNDLLNRAGITDQEERFARGKEIQEEFDRVKKGEFTQVIGRIVMCMYANDHALFARDFSKVQMFIEEGPPDGNERARMLFEIWRRTSKYFDEDATKLYRFVVQYFGKDAVSG